MSKKEKEEGKTVFTIIDVEHNTKEQKQNTINYSINLAKVTARDLVFYFLGKIKEDDYQEFCETVEKSKKETPSIYAGKSYKYDIKISYNREDIFWFNSINDIARKENAAFILMGISEEKKSLVKKVFGKTMWSIASNSDIPVILIPPVAKFSYFSEITIAADDEHKIQKIRWIKKIHGKFGTKIHIFVKNTEEIEKYNRSMTTMYQIKEKLQHEGIPYEVVHARNLNNFEKHLLRYAARNSQLLIIEVDNRYISDAIKERIQKLLFIDNQQFAVMLIKTEIIGILRWL